MMQNRHGNLNMQKVFSPSQLVALRAEFNTHDTDGSGEIELSELCEVVKSLGGQLSDEQVQALFREMDSDGSGTISWDEYLGLMIKLRTGRGLKSGAVAGLLARPPLIVLIEAEKGHAKYVTKLLRSARFSPALISQGRVEVVSHNTSESAMSWLLKLPASRRIAMLIVDTHGIRADDFCAKLSREMLSIPPIVYFAAEKRGGIPLPPQVKQYVLKDEIDERTARDLVESFCCIEDVHDPNDVPKHSSGHRRKDGMIGGRGKTGHRGSKTHHAQKIRPPNVFAKGRWKGSIGELSPRARHQLSEIGGGETVKVYHVKKDYIEQEQLEAKRKAIEEETFMLQEEKRRLAESRRIPPLPLWKTRLRETSVRSSSGLHFFDKKARLNWQGHIRKALPGTGHSFSLKERTREFFSATARSPRPEVELQLIPVEPSNPSGREHARNHRHHRHRHIRVASSTAE